jgi:hypothetical protein
LHLGAALSAADWASPLLNNGAAEIGIVVFATALESPTAIRAFQAHKNVLAATGLAKAGLPVSHGLPAAGA